MQTTPLWEKPSNRGITLEAMTAVTLLLAGADILVMRHPKAIELVRNYVADMAGMARPALLLFLRKFQKLFLVFLAKFLLLPTCPGELSLRLISLK